MFVAPDTPSVATDTRVLFVCTANACRSPIAEALFRQNLLVMGAHVNVGSAGTNATGAPATEHAVRAMAERGIDISAHRSRRLTPALVAEADLVLAMERSHAAQVVVLVPEAMRKTLTVRELGRRLWDVGAREANEPVVAWIERAVGDRDLRELLGTAHSADDVPDPIGRPISAYRQLIDELDDVLGRVARAVWTPPGLDAEANGGARGRPVLGE